MDSSRLSAEQVARLRVELTRQSRYLHALVERMADLRWNVNDPLWKSTVNATHAVDEVLRWAVVRRRPGGRLP